MTTADARNHSYLTWGVVLLALFLWVSSWQQRHSTVAVAVPEITVDDAAAAVGRGAVVIDVRERAAYERGHIAGALLVPLEELTRRVAEFTAMRGRELIVYCGDGSTLGPRGTKVLNDAGRPDAKNLTGGYSGWKAAGQPVAMGPK
jgi:rhodanese-related sulfurtransferase